MNSNLRTLYVSFAIVLGIGAVTLAQEVDLQAIAAGIQKNQEALSQYAWESRVAVSVDGEQKKVDVFQVRYDSSGQQEKTRIGGEADEKKVRGPVRKKMAGKKKKEAAEFANDVRETLASYSNPETMKKALASAFSRTEDGVFKLQSDDVVVQGDSMLIEVVAQTKQPIAFTVKTSVEGSPIVFKVMFQKLNDGTNYIAHSTIDTEFEKKKLSIVTENYNHIKQGG